MYSIQLTDDQEEVLRSAARDMGQSLDELVKEAIHRFLEELEDNQDAEEAAQAYNEFKESGEEGIPWETLKAQLDEQHGL